MDCLDAYDFRLPDTLIAQNPPQERDGGQLLHVDGLTCQTHPFTHLPSLLREEDLLIFNDSRTIPARLTGHKESGGRVEMLLERFCDDGSFYAQIGASRAPANGSIIYTAAGRFSVQEKRGAFYRLQAINDKAQPVNARQRFLRCGHMPLPPYIRRPATDADKQRYQTIFARRLGSVATPTASLHFTPSLLQALKARNIRTARLTLHVGLGTFSPIRGSLADHTLHAETYSIYTKTAALIRTTQKRQGRIVAIGTTVLRALEAAAERGDIAACHNQQTTLFIKPGFSFRIVDLLLTNFHMPRSSLFVLVCAFGGVGRVHQAYQQAIASGLRFYSYGDAMLLSKPPRV